MPSRLELMAVRNVATAFVDALDTALATPDATDPLDPRPGGTGSLTGKPEAAVDNMKPLPWTPEFEDELIAKVLHAAETQNRVAQGVGIANSAIGVIVSTLLPMAFPRAAAPQ